MTDDERTRLVILEAAVIHLTAEVGALRAWRAAMEAGLAEMLLTRPEERERP